MPVRLEQRVEPFGHLPRDPQRERHRQLFALGNQLGERQRLRASASPSKTAAPARWPRAPAANSGATPCCRPTLRGAASRSPADRATIPCAALSRRRRPADFAAPSAGRARYTRVKLPSPSGRTSCHGPSRPTSCCAAAA